LLVLASPDYLVFKTNPRPFNNPLLAYPMLNFEPDLITDIF
jgi:hypothetical protein